MERLEPQARLSRFAIKCDFHIPTAATAAVSLLPWSPAHSEAPRTDSRSIPMRQLPGPNPALAVLVFTHTRASLDLTEGKSATSEEIRSNVGREEGGESLGEIDDKRMH